MRLSSLKGLSCAKKAVAVISAVALCSTMTITTTISNSQKVDAAATANSTLIFSDEFNGSSLNTNKWVCEIGNGSGGWGNNELEYYTNRSENVYVSDGSLHIRARNEGYSGYNYTSARLKTQDKFYFQYGHIECRMAIPSGQGIWPAFWMLGQNIGSVGWPRCGEIDIMEAINAENKVYGTCHWDSNGHAEYGRSTGNFDITQYHTYVCDWDSQFIRMYVDGNMYYEINITNSTGSTEEFHNKFFLLFNVAVGGNWPGFSVDNSRFPQELKVDYVRVYQDNLNYTSNIGNAVDGNSGNNNNNNNNNSGSQPSNTGSGDVYIYQDANYGGRSASLGLGNYNLASLQAKGVRNDDLSSIKVPWGYKVTMYADDNFSGATKVVNGDTSYVGNDWNDRVSSIKVEKALYKIVNRHSGLCLDVSGGNPDNGANVQQWTDNGTNAQKWMVSFNSSDSTYVITSALSGRALDMGGWSRDNGGNAIMWDNNNTDNQRWYLTGVDNGYTFFINKYSNKALDVEGWSTAAGGNVHQWDYLAQANQQWKFIQVN
jgi:beta-glucanase (GH16 family)